MKAIITGSFDPITLGHENIITRAAAMFESVTVAICLNSSKPGMFSPDQRLAMAQAALKDLPNVEAVITSGLLADECRARDIRVIVRGIRSASDLDYEVALSRINRTLVPQLETVFLPCEASYSHISSNVVREMLRYHHSPASFVSKPVCEMLEKMIDKH